MFAVAPNKTSNKCQERTLVSFMPSLCLFVWVFAVFPSNIALAAGRDVMVAVMDNRRGEKTLHKQLVEHEGCIGLMSRLKKHKKEGQKMQLTLTDPPFSGYVIDLHCVRPDGTIIGRNGVGKKR